MKKSLPYIRYLLIFGVILLLIIPLRAVAQPGVPQTISYQGYLTDTGTGNPITDPAVLMRFSLHDALTGGTELWTETQDVNVNQGVYSVELGSSTVLPPSVDFNAQYYLEVAIDYDNSTIFDPGEELMPRQKLTSVGSAINADMVDGQHATDLGDITGVTAGTGLNGGGTSGDVTLDVIVPLSLMGSNSGSPVIMGTHTGNNFGIWGQNSVSGHYGMLGGPGNGVFGFNNGSGSAVYGHSNSGIGVQGTNATSGNFGYLGAGTAGVFGSSTAGWAGDFQGDVRITGNLQVTNGITGEADPLFTAWDKSSGISIMESQISDLNHFTNANESDPLFGASAASGITGQQITNWDTAFFNYDRTPDSWTNTGGYLYSLPGNVGIGTSTPAEKLSVAGTVESTAGGFRFPDGTLQTTASSSGDGHSLDSADASQTDVVFVDNSGNVGVGTQTPSERLDLIGKVRVTPGTYAYEQGNALIDFQTPRCSCDSTDNNVDCEFTFYSMNDEGMTCYDWYQVSNPIPPFTPFDYSNAFDQMSNPLSVIEMNATNDIVVRSLKIQPARYLYTQSASTYSGHLTPRCLCDTVIADSASECTSLGATAFYTNVDNGSSCYDWHLSGGAQESYLFARSIPVSLSTVDNYLRNGYSGIEVNDPTLFNSNVQIGTVSSNRAQLSVRNGQLDPGNYGIHAISLFGTAGYFFSNTGYGLIVEQGNVGIGTTTPAYPLDVNGDVNINGAIYQRGGATPLHADYVFEPDYDLESINEHADFMWKNKHLKAIPKATVDKSGVEIVDVGSHRRGIVEELEKAHIYIEQLHDQMSTQNKHIRTLEKRISELETFMKGAI